MAFYLLSEADRAAIARMLEQGGIKVLRNPPAPDEPLGQSNSPEIYVAKLPAGGIPGRSGTAPGHAVCELYLIEVTNPLTSDDATLEAVLNPDSTPVTKVVYNFGTSAISGDYVLLKRTKQGQWTADSVTVQGPFTATLQGTLSYGSYQTAQINAPYDPSWDDQIVTVYPNSDWGTGDSRSGAVDITWFPGEQKWKTSIRCNQIAPPT